MTIQYASDLHLEFSTNSRYMNNYPMTLNGDILLLAGDIIYLENRRMEQNAFFDWCSGHFRETIIVPGNHEYYHEPNRKGYLPGCKDVWDTMVDYEHFVRPNVRYVNNKSFKFGDVEIFATTLWTKVQPRDFGPLQFGMNDFNHIVMKGKRLLPGDYNTLHDMCLEWLEGALEKSDARHKVVLTHHCPSTARENDRYDPRGSLFPAFHVDMEPFIAEHDIDCWIYGHTHYNGGSGTVVPSKNPQGTRLLCNQLGYVQNQEDQNGYVDDAIIEIYDKHAKVNDFWAQLFNADNEEC